MKFTGEDAERLAEEGNFSYATDYAYDAGQGLGEETVRYISSLKEEAPWLLDFRLRCLEQFRRSAMPDWAPLKKADIDFSAIRYYLARDRVPRRSWEDVPDAVKSTFDRLGVPEREKKFLAGVEAQFDSEMAYAHLQEELAERGVLFVSSAEGLRDHCDLFRPFFGKIVPAEDNPFAALNGAVFSGGSFIHVPAGIVLEKPLQAYFRINAENFGQFERTLIVAGENSEVTYLEGCTAPRFETATLHAAVVELVALPGAKIHYLTVQNWSRNVYNLVTKRGLAREGAQIRWLDCNIGSRLTMKYPAVLLAGRGARGEMVSLSIAARGQQQDTGARMVHLAPQTSSRIIAKSLSIGDGIATYRGSVTVAAGASACRSHTRCDALLLHPESVSRTYPKLSGHGDGCTLEHEAAVSKISEEQLFYLRQRGFGENQAIGLLVNGFFQDLLRRFPLEYAVELRRLLEMEVEA
ncbi:MAG: Fe-S cluster assembly protein SufB [Puniceicoccales bacterium]|jgi:Fe-S cluster assembly protein SufB|nr:Fe-S cluster assembly protein SufB [Puniceicoccales bacterium]